jgi:copper chaperone CopZ
MECCEEKNKALKSGLLYGLVPHIGCIVFIVFSILGVTSATFLFRDLLLNSYFFYLLIALSMVFASISAFIYIKRKNLNSEAKFKISLSAIKREWKYITTLYSTTILINLLLFMVIFPLTANISFATKNTIITNSTAALTLQVDIPCSGHAPLVTDELKKLDGISDVKFRFPNYFDVSYDNNKLSKNQILSLEIFKNFKANLIK